MDDLAGSWSLQKLGNGSAMRVSPVAYAARDAEEVLELAKRSAECTHNHPEGIKGAQAVALAIHAAQAGQTKEDIMAAISEKLVEIRGQLRVALNGIKRSC